MTRSLDEYFDILFSVNSFKPSWLEHKRKLIELAKKEKEEAKEEAKEEVKKIQKRKFPRTQT